MTATIQAVDTDDDTLYILRRPGHEPVVAYWPHPLRELCPEAVTAPAYGEVEWPHDLGQPVVVPQERWWTPGPMMLRAREALEHLAPARRRPAKIPKTVPKRIGEARARAAWVLHTQQDYSIWQISRKHYKAWGFTSAKSCSSNISIAWKVMGLKARGRIEMTVLKSTKHGLAPRDRKKRAALRKARGLTSHRGVPLQPLCLDCTNRSMKDSDYCFAHDPRHREATAARLERMRATSRARLVDGTEAILLVQYAYRDVGAWQTIGKRCGIAGGVMKRIAAYPPGQLMKPHVVAKIVEGLGEERAA